MCTPSCDLQKNMVSYMHCFLDILNCGLQTILLSIDMNPYGIYYFSSIFIIVPLSYMFMSNLLLPMYLVNLKVQITYFFYLHFSCDIQILVLILTYVLNCASSKTSKVLNPHYLETQFSFSFSITFRHCFKVRRWFFPSTLCIHILEVCTWSIVLCWPLRPLELIY